MDIMECLETKTWITFLPTPVLLSGYSREYPNVEYTLQKPLKTPGLPIRAFLKNPLKCPDLI
jgi:hypothetical protein